MTYDVDTLIQNHLQLAKDIAYKEWRTAPHALSKDNLLSDANLGLVDAARRWESYCAQKQYDPSAVQYFKVFAGLRIRGAIRDQIRKDDWTTRTVRTKSRKLRDAGQDEGATIEELAEKTNMTVSEINKVNVRMSQKPVSLEQLHSRLEDDRDSSDRGLEISNAMDTESEVFVNTMSQFFVAKLKQLDYLQQLIIVMHYYVKMPLDEIGCELDLAHDKVLKLHTEAALSLRDTMAKSIGV